MSYVTGPKRIIRNPITGEELHYTKGTKDPNEQGPQIPLAEHKNRVNDLVKQSPRQETPKSHFITSFENNKPSASVNSSTKANASSVPIMDFSEISAHRIIGDDDEGYKNNSILSPILSYQNRLNKIVAGNFALK